VADKACSLKALTMEQIDEDQIRLIGAYSRPNIKIVLTRCQLRSAGTRTLAEVLGHNQGPTSLVDFGMDNAGNSRLKCLILRYSRNNEDGNREVLAAAGALKENKGLDDLGLRHDFSLSSAPGATRLPNAGTLEHDENEHVDAHSTVEPQL
jgi:hypothetical protein